MLKFFEDNYIKIYYTHSNLKAVVIERFNRSLRELMMKSFVKSNNTVWYNILTELIKTYNNRYHHTIKMKPIDINKSNEKQIKNTVYNYDITNKLHYITKLLFVKADIKNKNDYNNFLLQFEKTNFLKNDI